MLRVGRHGRHPFRDMRLLVLPMNCEDCGRPIGASEGMCAVSERNADAYGWIDDCRRLTIARLTLELLEANARIAELLAQLVTEPDGKADP